MPKRFTIMYFLEVSGISKKHGGMQVLQETSFVQPASRKTAIAGETGAGKSTLLKIIAGLEQPDTGTVLFRGKKVFGPNETLIPGHPGIGYLSQHFELRNNYRVEEILDQTTKLRKEDAETLFEICRISHLLKRRTDQLSGGEKQRIALARLLVASPRLLLLDEPFSNMDPIHKNLLRSVLQDIGDRLQITCMLTSHEPMDTLSWADEIWIMHKGSIIQEGSPTEIYHHPMNEYAAGLMGSYTMFTKTESLLFPVLQQMPERDGKIFARPGLFNIGTGSEEDSVRATVEKISFKGAYYEVVLLAGTKKIVSETLQPDCQEGDKVHLSCKLPKL
jgi:iron(III) transport system ATP-binding protein